MHAHVQEKKQILSISLSQELILKLRETAKQYGISVSSLIELILKGKQETITL